MDYSEVDHFLERAFLDNFSQWDQGALTKISTILEPDVVLGARKTALRADIKSLWARWFVEGLYDPHKPKGHNFTEIYSKVKRSINDFNAINTENNISIAKELTRVIYAEISQKQDANRIQFSQKQKETLLVLAGKEARCSICGYNFSSYAIDSFLNKDLYNELGRPLFIDYMTGHGAKKKDLLIEIDHIVPISHGGANDLDNLQLLCGWCNRHKSNYNNFYESNFSPKSIRHPKLGKLSIPRPLWIIRALATKQKCEHPGCSATNKDSRLYVMPKHVHGAPNPISIKIVCSEHDSLEERFIPNK
jgi:hypothetical protein